MRRASLSNRGGNVIMEEQPFCCRSHLLSEKAGDGLMFGWFGGEQLDGKHHYCPPLCHHKKKTRRSKSPETMENVVAIAADNQEFS